MRLKTATVLFLGMALLPMGSALAASGILNMDRAVTTALQNNPQVHAAEASAQAADQRRVQARAHRYPSLDLSEAYNWTDNPAQAFALKLNQKRFDFNDFVQTDPNNPPKLTTWITSLQLTLPVFTGGKLSARINQAGLMANAERLSYNHAAEKVAFETMTAYTNLAKARELLGLMHAARTTTAQHVELAEKYAAQGMIVEAEVLKARVELARMDELVEKAENGAQLAEAALDFQMGVDQNTHQELAPIPPPPPVQGELKAWIQAALENRHDLLAARKKLEAGRLEIKAATSGYYPEVAIVGRYDLYDKAAFGGNGDATTVMAVARINLLRGGSDKAARAAARYETASHEADIRRFEEGISLSVRQA
ncbi:MAG: TolC family protein [Acidobacteria bacterium]|nr:TolC family protein [Acidobacteriota bacterium]